MLVCLPTTNRITPCFLRGIIQGNRRYLRPLITRTIILHSLFNNKMVMKREWFLCIVENTYCVV